MANAGRAGKLAALQVDAFIFVHRICAIPQEFPPAPPRLLQEIHSAVWRTARHSHESQPFPPQSMPVIHRDESKGVAL